MNQQDFSSMTDNNSFMLKLFENTLHDIKTPFSIILSIIQSLEKNSDLPEDVQESIFKMKNCCYKISKLIRDMNDSNKIAFERFIPNYINYDMVFLTESISQSISPIAARKNIDIIFDTSIEEKIIAVDKTLFERILLNLLSNAIKFSEPGSEIFVNFCDNVDIVSIEIIDSGCGVDEDKINMIFNRYESSQVDHNKEGYGIGLDIVRELIFVLNGHIMAKRNKNNKGLIMHLDLPVFMVEEDLADKSDIADYFETNIFQMELSGHLNE